MAVVITAAHQEHYSYC